MEIKTYLYLVFRVCCLRYFQEPKNLLYYANRAQGKKQRTRNANNLMEELKKKIRMRINYVNQWIVWVLRIRPTFTLLRVKITKTLYQYCMPSARFGSVCIITTSLPLRNYLKPNK